MRATTTCQLPLTVDHGDHEHLSELQEISRVLDVEPGIAATVHSSLTRGCRADRGRQALTADQVLRAAILYKVHNWSFSELQFELQFNDAYRSFCRLAWGQAPSRSTLHRDIRSITAEDWQHIHRYVVAIAARRGVEDGKAVRIDTTVTESTIHHPTDSSLLWDCIRKLTDLMDGASPYVRVSYRNHRRVAKRRALAILNAKRAADRIQPYRDLIATTRKVVGYAGRVERALRMCHHPLALARAEGLAHFARLAGRVIEQAERRVLLGESVPASEKIVSIFEEHTDIICKGGRDTVYGHKICVSAGASSIITDCVVLDGNPSDSSLAVEMVERHAEICGSVPSQAAFDGGFASKEGLAALHALGVRDVMFHKRMGIEVAEMVSESWIYRKLRRFRAGIEGLISFLKRATGAGRARWRTKAGFDAFVHSSVVAANLLVLARHALA